MLALPLAGCGAGHEPPKPANFSPNGEPLSGAGWPKECDDAIGIWFDRVDTNHDGFVSRDEFFADAERQYAVMDLRHDGKVSAAELATYRQSVMGRAYVSISTPEALMSPRARRAAGDSDSAGWGGRGGSGDDEDAPRNGGKAPLSADIPDPVMSADADLDGSVSPDEFRNYVSQTFAGLDRHHDGMLTKSEVAVWCKRTGG